MRFLPFFLLQWFFHFPTEEERAKEKKRIEDKVYSGSGTGPTGSTNVYPIGPTGPQGYTGPVGPTGSKRTVLLESDLEKDTIVIIDGKAYKGKLTLVQ